MMISSPAAARSTRVERAVFGYDLSNGLHKFVEAPLAPYYELIG